MSRKITGSPEYRGGRWQVKVTKPDGSRPWVDLPGSIPRDDPERAKRVALIVATRIHNGDSVPMERGETVLEYGARWYGWRKKRAVSSAGEDLSHLRTHFFEKHGALPMAGIMREHLEDFVTHLDERVLEDEMAWRTARNVWGSVAVMFRDAFGAKDRTVRVVEMSSNPAAGVAPPDKGEETALQFLYPSEFLTLVACPKVPLLRRRLYAYAVYSYSRAGEIVPVRWARDVQLDHDVIHIHEAEDRKRRPGQPGTTKNEAPRRIPLEPALRPMLEAMGANAKGLVFPVMPAASGDVGLANLLRDDLVTAGVDRPELHHKCTSTRPLRFHDLRATGITWMAVQGLPPLKIKERAGHKTLQTTERYVRLAESLGHGFGEPFPPLPACLFESPKNRPNAHISGKNEAKSVGAAGLEPATSSV
jgi:integrase